MNRPRIIYRDFALPFLTQPSETAESDDEEDDVAHTDIDWFENQIPKNAIFLGSIEDEVSNWTSWKIEDHYYIVPWEGPDFDWALFRISWDDNWGSYSWSTDARIKGVADPNDAARQMVKGLFARWQIDLRKSENSPHRSFLAAL